MVARRPAGCPQSVCLAFQPCLFFVGHLLVVCRDATNVVAGEFAVTHGRPAYGTDLHDYLSVTLRRRIVKERAK